MKQYLIIFFLSFSFLMKAQFPAMPNQAVLDEAYVLSEEEEINLNNKVTNFSTQTGIPVKLVTKTDVAQYGAASMYAYDLWFEWQMDQLPQKNGLLVLYSVKIGQPTGDMKDHCRIVTGLGLQKTMLSDELVIKDIKRDMMAQLPDQPYQAFDVVTDSLFTEVMNWKKLNPNDPLVTPESVTTENVETIESSSESSSFVFWIWILLLCVGVGFGIYFFVRMFSSPTEYQKSEKSEKSENNEPSYGSTTSSIITGAGIGLSASSLYQSNKQNKKNDSSNNNSTSGCSSSVSSSCSGGGGGGCGGGGCGGGCGG